MTFTINNYDFTNPKHYKLIDDYVFFKYYVKVLFDTWNNFFFTSKLDISCICKIIIKHQNPLELERFEKLFNNTIHNNLSDFSINSILAHLFYLGKSTVIKLYSFELKDKFNL
jgi:hypothetical protein